MFHCYKLKRDSYRHYFRYLFVFVIVIRISRHFNVFFFARPSSNKMFTVGRCPLSGYILSDEIVIVPQVVDENLRSVPINVTEKSPGVYNIDYTISSSGKHTVMVRERAVVSAESTRTRPPYRCQSP